MTSNLTYNQICVLSAIAKEDQYGLGIIKEVKESSGIKIVLGSLYNILAKLEKLNFVESYWGEATENRGGNRRRYYKITGVGEQMLLDTQNGLNNLWSGLQLG
tara:strand:- start:65 stop:373 length:309 start_codon:yes stop_codon:yes gene_type:complete